MACLVCNIAMGYFESYGALTKKSESDANGALNLTKKFCSMMDATNATILAQNGKEKFYIRSNMCHEFLYSIFECAIKKVGNMDGEYCKYSAGHIVRMLL